MKLSNFGKKFTRPSGIGQLMVDLDLARKNGGPDVCMLGGGNPARIPQVQQLLSQQMERLLQDHGFASAVGDYDGPQGESRFIATLANYLNNRFGWSISSDNIALTNGSQNSFFYLFNALAGEMPDGSHKKIMFPLAPEYVGYADAGISDDMFVSQRPTIELIDEHYFKYHVDFDALSISDEIAAICLSRPTNPTGNVITDEELKRLMNLSKQHHIPLILDNAYGQPFPNIIYSDSTIEWHDNLILCMSLSKLGLPGARTGIVVGNEQVTQLISSLSGIITLAPNSMGAALTTHLIEKGLLDDLCKDVILEFYRQRLESAKTLFNRHFSGLPARLHLPEGAFFLWMWIQDLPISANELYQRLKRRDVFVIPGEEFFIGLEDDWEHARQCIRINYAQDEATLDRGFSIIADEIAKLY